MDGEDLAINRHTNNIKNGFYVDIGAHHPVHRSNTCLLYQSGWRGINIDINEFSLDLNASVFIGDKPSDIIAGNAANIGLNMLLSKNKTNELTPYSYTLIHSLYEAIPLLQTA